MTVDVETLDDGAATIRERDSMTQERVTLDLLPQRIADLVAGRSAWEGVPREAPHDGGLMLDEVRDALERGRR